MKPNNGVAALIALEKVIKQTLLFLNDSTSLRHLFPFIFTNTRLSITTFHPQLKDAREWQINSERCTEDFVDQPALQSMQSVRIAR